MATSLPMSREQVDHLKMPHQIFPVKDWGRNKDILKKPEKVTGQDSKQPNWKLSSQWPTKQHYDLTLLKRSNLRANDELIEQMSGAVHQYGGSHFPKEHPLASHISRFEVFPKFVPSRDDPKQGMAASTTDPKGPHTRNRPLDVHVVHKTANGYGRHEILHLPLWSRLKGYDARDDLYNEKPRRCFKKSTADNQSQLYPAPSKLVLPYGYPLKEQQDETVVCKVHPDFNVEAPKPNLQVQPPVLSPRSANVLHNIEREQWLTQYQLHFTGKGSAMPVKLDNWARKEEDRKLYGRTDDDSLEHHVSAYDRPEATLEGGSHIEERNMYLQTTNAAQSKANRTMAEPTERSVQSAAPAVKGSRTLYQPTTSSEQTDQNRPALERSHTMPNIGTQRPMTLSEKLRVDEEQRQINSFKEVTKRNHDARMQQMEAENRWLLLERHTPAHHIQALRNKQKVTWTNEQPKMFYDHAGRYVTERTNLYQSSNFNPVLMAERLDMRNQKRTGGPTSLDTSQFHADALSAGPAHTEDGSGLNPADGKHWGKKSNVWDVFYPYWAHREEQTHRLKGVHYGDLEARDTVLEGGTPTKTTWIQRQSEYGDNYNSFKFLQDHVVPDGAAVSYLTADQTISADNNSLNAVPSANRPEGVLRHPVITQRPIGVVPAGRLLDGTSEHRD